MALKEYKLPFGRGFQTVMLPEEHVSDVLEGVPTAACDIKEATVECMRRPMAPRRLPKKYKKATRSASSWRISPARGTMPAISPSMWLMN